jgi:hypothetical protein
VDLFRVRGDWNGRGDVESVQKSRRAHVASRGGGVRLGVAIERAVS